MKGKKRKKKLLIALVIVLLLIAAVPVIVMYVAKSFAAQETVCVQTGPQTWAR